MFSSELGSLRKKEFLLPPWRNSYNDLFENLIFGLAFSAIVLK